MTGDDFRALLRRRADSAGLVVSGTAVELLARYFELLVRWNDRINLTALPLAPVGDKALDRLFIEPLFATRLVPDRTLLWYDVGSGGGSPAVPIKVARPAARLVMVESKTRKAAFLREVVRDLGLTTSEVADVRFETFARTAAPADLVTVRAVRVDEQLLSAVERVLVPGGALLLFTSGQKPDRIPVRLERVAAETLPTGEAKLLLFRKANSDVPRGTVQTRVSGS